MSYEMILRAGELKDGMEVTKITGEKVYIVKREIKVHAFDKSQKGRTITAGEGTVFLVPARGTCSDITAFPSEKKLKVKMSLDELHEFVIEEEGEIGQ